jgi:hypothetical protein
MATYSTAWLTTTSPDVYVPGATGSRPQPSDFPHRVRDALQD